MRSRWATVVALGASLLVGAPERVAARKQGELRYPYDQVWNAALRLVRVDMRMPITDRDQEAGYLLFDYQDHGKRFPGSVELVRGERGQRPITKAVIQVAGMPSYIEQLLLDKLERKLRDEYGEPIEAPKPPAVKPKPPDEKPPADAQPEDPNAPLVIME